jgi:proline iminopeptidase
MKIRIGDKQLFFDVEGLKMPSRGSSLTENPTLVLLHGAPGFSDHSVFKPAFSRLRDEAQLIYLDLAGAGRSEDEPDGIFSLERWADDLVELCDRLEIRRPVVLGLSGGGFVAGGSEARSREMPRVVCWPVGSMRRRWPSTWSTASLSTIGLLKTMRGSP